MRYAQLPHDLFTVSAGMARLFLSRIRRPPSSGNLWFSHWNVGQKVMQSTTQPATGCRA